MGNMSYCLFENTLGELHDCLERINNDLSESEARARDDLITVCMEISATAKWEQQP